MAATLINHGGNVKSPVNPVALLGKQDKYRLDGSLRLTDEELDRERRELIRRLEE